MSLQPIMYVVGVQSNFMKMAPVMHAMIQYPQQYLLIPLDRPPSMNAIPTLHKLMNALDKIAAKAKVFSLIYLCTRVCIIDCQIPFDAEKVRQVDQ